MITPANRSDILIAGGSYAGLALALALSRQSGGDLRVTIAAPAFPPLDVEPSDIRASALSRASLHLLDHLGIWQTLAPHAQPVTSIELTDSALGDAFRPTRLRYDLGLPGSSAIVPAPRAGEGQGEGTVDHAPSALDLSSDLPKMVIVENHRLGVALLAAACTAPGITLLENCAVETFAATPDDMRATLTDGRTLVARLLAAADGSRSTLREQAGIRTIGHPYEQAGIIVIVEPELPHHGRAIQHFLPAGPFALLPMTRNRICITWTESATEAHRILALDAHAFRAEVEKRYGHQFGNLKSISSPKSWPLSMAIARDLIAPRFALVGDAAHTIHPLAGQGINLGFRDIAALTETIIDAARLGLDFGRQDTLQRYERWRRFDNLTSAAGFDAVNQLFANGSTLARSARGAALSLADRLPTLKSWLTDEAAGQTGDIPHLLRARR